jgi:hypothetical protein
LEEREVSMKLGTTGRWWLRLAAAALLLTGAAGFVACSDDDGDGADSTPAATAAATQEVSAEEASVQQVFLDAIEAWNADDVEGFTAFFTDEGLISSFGDEGRSIEEVRAGLPNFVGSQELGNPTFLDTNVTGETATMDNTFSLGSILLRSKFGLIQVDGDWKLNSEESNLPLDIPEGTTVVPVDMNEFAYGVDTNPIVEAKGPFALVAQNVGKQTHMLGLARVPADANIDELLLEDEPEGLEFIGGGDEVEPGASSNIVFVAPLDAGRYIMVCFLPDTDDTSEEGSFHYEKGMTKEFTVE